MVYDKGTVDMVAKMCDLDDINAINILLEVLNLLEVPEGTSVVNRIIASRVGENGRYLKNHHIRFTHTTKKY